MSGPQEYAARHARDPFEALPHGSIFDAPEAGRAAAVASARELVAQFRACTEGPDADLRLPNAWIGRAAAVLGELTRDG